ncbi:hypothetical protein WA158_001675 [Blastocystis sp. Blastoise]
MQPTPALNPRDLENLLKKPVEHQYTYKAFIRNGPLPAFFRTIPYPEPKDETFYGLYPPNLSDKKYSCFDKVVQGAIFGFVGGVGMGVMLGAFQQMTMPADIPLDDVVGKVPKGTMLKEAKNTFRFWYLKGKGMGKQFFLFNAGYMGLECVLERIMGERSYFTLLTSSCAAGGLVNVTGGPVSMTMGCVGFMLFSKKALECSFDNHKIQIT